LRNILDPPQEAAVERALAFDGFCFYFEPRVGKTRSALEVINRRLDVQFLIIVAPKGVINVWQAAIHAGELRSGVIVELINFESFNSKKNRKKHRQQSGDSITMVIVDEAHRIKKRSNKQSKGIRTLVPHSRYRLALTATPLDKSIEQCWPIFNFIDPEIFGKYPDFESRYLRMGGYMGYKVIGYKNEDEFKRIYHEHSAHIRLTDVSHRRIKVNRKIVRLKMSDEGRTHYDELEENLVTSRGQVRVRAPLAITLSMRLQQITGGYLCDKKTQVLVDDTKLKAVVNLAKESIPFVVVCRYRHEMDEIAERLKKFSTLIVRGGEPLLSPRPNVDIVIIQTTAGIGIDLSQATTIIFYSWDYSYINYEQMRFRILSRSQTTARYIFLMIENSIDEVIYDAAVRKKKLSAAINEYYRSRRG
jgi:superfamily II DNA or RNA helicase